MSKKRTSKSTDFSVISDEERGIRIMHGSLATGKSHVEYGAWTDFVVWVSGKADVPRDTRATWSAFKAGWHACRVAHLVAMNKRLVEDRE